jgi:hypothetical protein
MSNNLLKQLVAENTEKARANYYNHELENLIRIQDAMLSQIARDYPWSNADDLIVELTEDAKIVAKKIADLIIEHGVKCSDKLAHTLREQSKKYQ